jgi:hypothetical protein
MALGGVSPLGAPMWRRWPLPAVYAWGGGWALMLAASCLGWSAGGALLLGMVPSLLLQGWVAAGWRRWMVLGGLPLLMLITAGVSLVGPWGWLGLALALLVIYPLQAWCDAPVFPTPGNALEDLAAAVPLVKGAAVLDAGSGLGHGMDALRRAYPSARLQGVESSLALVLLSRWRLRRDIGHDRLSTLPPCKVVRGDMWSCSWEGFDLVYMFQRPESMQRAWDKACREMSEGAWLVSLEFEVPDLAPTRRLTCPDGRAVLIYRLGRPRDSIAGSIGR